MRNGTRTSQGYELWAMSYEVPSAHPLWIQPSAAAIAHSA